MKRIFFLALAAYVFVSCKSNEISKYVSDRFGSQVLLNLGYSIEDSLLIDSITESSEFIITLPIVDNVCAKCSFSLLNDINVLIDSLDAQGISCIAYVSTGYTELNNFCEGVLSNVVIIDDEDSTYAKMNHLIGYTSMYNTLLLDRDERIILVGNPIYNNNIKQLYKNIIETNNQYVDP